MSLSVFADLRLVFCVLLLSCRLLPSVCVLSAPVQTMSPVCLLLMQLLCCCCVFVAVVQAAAVC
jgi:hypothetical protein